ncbi:hypothetical protein AB0F71_32415 [Kitasatospora sp. NPDC028055]|uniref:hypothetical protein n=1 Tax=Kitasatospora sp. NPDC028055 TaxID=3155653 RepID=UPI0033C2AA27
MSSPALTPPEAARWAALAGLPLPDDRHAEVAATADHIRSVVAVLRELDLGDTPPASAYRATQENAGRTREHPGPRNAGTRNANTQEVEQNDAAV